MTRITFAYLLGVIIFSLLCFSAGGFYLFQEQVNLATVIICCAFGFVISLTAAYIYSNHDPWAREKARLEKFWWEVFGYRIDWGIYALPRKSREFSRLEIYPGFSLEKLINDSGNCQIARVWLSRNPDLFKRMQNAQSMHARPTKPYAFIHRGTASPDSKYRCISYHETCLTDITFMTDTEYVIRCLRNTFEKRALFGQPFEGTVLDVPLSGHSAVWAYWSESIHIDFQECHNDGRCAYSGPREIVLADSHVL